MGQKFDEVIDRTHTGSIKHDFPQRFGKGADEIPLWVADMDFRAPQEVIDRLQEVALHGIYGYSDIDDSYGEIIKSWFNKRFHWNLDTDWMVKTPGVIFAISSAVRAFTEPGDAIIIQQPVYHPFVSCVVENGRRLINNELVNNNGRYEMDLSDFEEKIVSEGVKLFILCSPHNPVGRVWTRTELEAVGAICRRHNVFVLSDEIHCDFVYPGHAHTVFASVSEEFADHCAICTAPSKTFNLAGLQISHIFIPNADNRKRFQKQVRLTGYDEINLFGLNACRAAYQYGEAWLEELKLYLAGNVRLVKEYLAERIPQVRLIEPEGTYLLWLDFSGLSMTEEELIGFLDREAGVWLNAGSIFGEKSAMFQRMNIASPASVIQEALERLERAVRKREERK